MFKNSATFSDIILKVITDWYTDTSTHAVGHNNDNLLKAAQHARPFIMYMLLYY